MIVYSFSYDLYKILDMYHWILITIFEAFILFSMYNYENNSILKEIYYFFID